MLVLHSVITNEWSGNSGGMTLAANCTTRGKVSTTQPTCSLLLRNRTRNYAVTGWLLTSWTRARP